VNPQTAIEARATLPGAWYVDEEVFAAEQELIFGREWQYAGPAAAVERPGDFVTYRAGRVPLVIVRDGNGSLNAFVNVCRHRGAEVVVAESGNRQTLQCHYHAWTYGLDGCLRAAPGEKDQPGFDRREFSLLPVQADTWGPFLFVNPDPDAPPLAEALGELRALVTDSGLDLGALRLRETADYDVRANWKAIVDNQLECYHCPVAHPSFMTLVDTDDYTTEDFGTFVLQRGRVRESARDGGAPYRIGDGVRDSFYVFLWPNFALNVYPGPGNVSVNVYLPLAADRSLARYHYFFTDAVRDEELAEFSAFIDGVQREDIVLVESVQRGLSSGRYDRGRLFAGREDALAAFAERVTRALASAG
jgi:phenylpropionate dioxygenase-like ring-hydroxylating dioxygenase large terminal subunit